MASSSRARFSGPPGRICSFVLPTLVVAIAVAGCDSDSSASLATGPSPIKCQLSLTGTKVIGSEGGPGAIDVTAQPECAWTASTSAAWITDVAPRSGQGTAEVQFRVASNPTAVARESELVVNDERIRIAQEAAECHYEIRPAQWPAAAAGGRGQAELVTLDGCRWDASVDVPWITLVSAASGAGGASVVFDVASNAGGPRTGVITIAGRSLTVTQGALACSYAITPAAYDAPTLGGAAPPVTVSAPATCAWTTNSNVAWLSVTSGSSGSGTGVVTFVVSPNVGGVRTGTIAIADQLLTVTQQPLACLYTVSPLAATVPAAGGPGPSITVTAPAGCAWTAASNDAWLTITAGASGTGPGVVDFDVAANAGAARSGTLTIAGQTFTVTQDAAACTYAISPVSYDAPAPGGAGPSIAVTATAGCAWTAVSNDAWITVDSGSSGTGDGVVTFSVGANAGAPRTGTMTIAGQTFTVAQP
jgi:hypothetical protein